MNPPAFHFFVSGERDQITTQSYLWKRPLLDRDYPVAGKSEPVRKTGPTIGDYFLCAKQFLETDNYRLIKKGIRYLLQTSVEEAEICQINLYLEKHGACYHPIRIHVLLGYDQSCFFVLNGAISRHGMELAQKEYGMILELRTVSKQWLPQVFGFGRAEIGGVETAFLFGQWLDGYNEFHLTKDRNHQEIVIWGLEGSCTYVPERDFFPVYGQMAEILTFYYNVDTFQQIFPWHHAAGDFVIRRGQTGYDVKLITVRGYENLTEFPGSEPENVQFRLPALFFFFLNLTLRMRVDRLNGTGHPVLASEDVLDSVVQGFFKGLLKKFGSGQNEKLKSGFVEFFNQFTLEQIMEIMENILGEYPFAASESGLIQGTILSHYKKLTSLLRTI